MQRQSGFLPAPDWRRSLVGESRPIRKVSEIIGIVAPRRSTVLITGETGTGKEVVARAIHAAGPRRQAPMVAVNLSAIPENLIEAELFGHVKGAYTGAWQNRAGRLEQAGAGTLFLDEIGDVPLDLQAKLLRVLQEREFQRVGSSEAIRLEARVIAATHRDLARRIEEGRFREDLYYRLNVVPIHVPPLRERSADIPALVRHFVAKVCEQEGTPGKTVSPDALEMLARLAWPGNVRQLENAVERAVAMSGDRELLLPADFAAADGPAPAPAGDRAGGGVPLVTLPEGGLDFERTVARIERSILEQALRMTGGNKSAAAGMLGLKRTTLSAKIRSFGEMLPEGAVHQR
jgi:DNA-binding NtrC family response regulator